MTLRKPRLTGLTLAALLVVGWTGFAQDSPTKSKVGEKVDSAVQSLKKGAHEAAYSGFEGATDDGTGLADWLREHGVDSVDVVGLATDYCVRATAADAATKGFGTRVLLGLTAGVSPGTTSEAIESLQESGVEVTPA